MLAFVNGGITALIQIILHRIITMFLGHAHRKKRFDPRAKKIYVNMFNEPQTTQDKIDCRTCIMIKDIG